MRQLPLGVRLRDSARFASFVPGFNREVLDLLRAGPAAGGAPRVLWLWGRAGTGKTHLLQAACAEVGERGGRAAYLDLADATPGLLDGCETLDLVALDSLDARAAEESWNRAIFRLHTLMQDAQGRLLVASASPPASLPIVLPDLRSRLLAASIHQLHELDDVDQVAALQLRASRRGLDLSEEGALYLVHRLPRDLHSLFEVLDELDDASLAAQRRLTVPFLREALEARRGRGH